MIRNEKDEVDARREFYSNLQTNDYWIRIGEITGDHSKTVSYSIRAYFYLAYGGIMPKRALLI